MYTPIANAYISFTKSIRCRRMFQFQITSIWYGQLVRPIAFRHGGSVHPWLRTIMGILSVLLHLCERYPSDTSGFPSDRTINAILLCLFSLKIYVCVCVPQTVPAFLAATKQLYVWYFLSVCPSVCLSVCHTFLTMFPSLYHHEIFRSYHQRPW